MNKPILIVGFLILFIIAMIILNDANELTVEKYWENPSIFQVNREEPRAHFFPFESEELAIENDPTKSKFFQSLNGSWKFHFAKNPNDKPKGFYQSNYSVIKWDDIGTLKFIKETPTQLSNKFMDCCANDLFSLLDGVLYKCPVSAHGTNLKAFSFDPSYDGVDLTEEKITLKNLKEKLIDFYHNNKYVTACSYCAGRGYGEGEVGAAVQTKKALPLFAQS